MPYQIQVRLADADWYLSMLDRDEEWIEEHIAGPRREGRAILFAGKVLEWPQIDEIHITYTDQASEQILRAYENQGEVGLYIPFRREHEFLGKSTDVTNLFITGAPGAQPPKKPAEQGPAFATNRKAVMVIYGHDREANNALFGWLRAIGLQPREWNQLAQLSGSASPYIGQVLEHAFQHVQAVIALFTPDEHVRGRDALSAASNTWRLQARPNVLIEAGMALVTHPNRTVLVTLGPQELPTDLAGRHYIRLNHTAGPLNDIANRLQAAGCEIDLTGTDWLDHTRFPNRDATAPSPPPRPGSARQQAAAETADRHPQKAQVKMPPPESPEPSTMTGDGPATISGDGVYLVGLDIQPGTYRTAGPADGSRSCYYALLSSTNTNDIIDNNNVKGPATITVGPDVKAVNFSGCKPWHRLGR